MTLVFDTETNGKALDFKAPMTDTNNWPRVVQLAWAVYNDAGVIVRGFQHIIRPDGWEIPPAVVEIHGITYDRAMADGIPARDAITRFIGDYENCDTIVAHNFAFDYPVLGCEFIRYGLAARNRITRQICTMQSSIKFCALPGKFRGQFKWPKLAELHQILFDEGFDGAHDAMNDVKACGRAYFELKRRGIIK